MYKLNSASAVQAPEAMIALVDMRFALVLLALIREAR